MINDNLLHNFKCLSYNCVTGDTILTLCFYLVSEESQILVSVCRFVLCSNTITLTIKTTRLR